MHKEDGFHTKVWLDAGGHRSLYAPGDEISANEALEILQSNIASKLPTPADSDKVFGAMIKHLGKITIRLTATITILFWSVDTGLTVYGPEPIQPGSIATWRQAGEAEEEVAEVQILNLGFSGVGIRGYATTATGGYAADETNKKLKVESFQHWVWVAGVDDKYSDTDDKVSYTWSGEDIHNIQGVDSKGTPNRYLWPKTGTYLPWTGGISWITEGEKARSSTEMVWKWKDYSYSAKLESGKYTYWYDWGAPMYPSIPTRYFDGSP